LPQCIETKTERTYQRDIPNALAYPEILNPSCKKSKHIASEQCLYIKGKILKQQTLTATRLQIVVRKMQIVVPQIVG
jgi:hypothetical protein